MAEPTCTQCGKIFKTNYLLKKHGERKTPCKKSLTVEHLEKVIETLQTGLPNTDSPFRLNSKKFHESLSKEQRQEQGIFFTPSKARRLLFEKLKEFGCTDPKKILEPSFGSGEFLEDLYTLYPKATIYGVEKNPKLFASVSKENLVQADFFEYNENKNSIDLIVGNPPYFVIDTKDMTKKEKEALKEKWKDSMNSRLNIYIAFLYKCLHEHLAPGGYLAFVIPTSLMNCSYYQPMREYIASNASVRYIEPLDVKYYETGQDTMLFILEKKLGGTDYMYRMNNNLYFSPKWKELEMLVKDTQTLHELGWGSKTGEVVWNQDEFKSKMSESGTLVIYNTNIQNGKLVLGNITSKVGKSSEKKRQYIQGCSRTPLVGPMILVNRGHGNATYKFNYVFIPETQGKFYAENHVNVLYPKTDEAKVHTQKILKSFANEKTAKFIEWFVGNGSLNSTELEHLLPIF